MMPGDRDDRFDPLAPQEHRAVMEAVRAAEAGTSGEIRVVLSTRPLVTPWFHALLWTALLALVAPWPLAMASRLGVPALLSVQAVVFVAVGSLLLFSPLSRLVVPRSVIDAAGRSAAIDQFLLQNIGQTRGQTGVLIFVALEERLVEVVADGAVHEKVGHGAWQEVCAAVLQGAARGRLSEGLCEGVRQAGRVLAVAAPAQPGDINELPDRVVVI
ncbi:hypothetical protein MWN34_04085 [Ancylobacter sp. 6x-1]|uniref:TPM domain-containing protein n=1 Tax=Ancylobacter crimeensis TaxID=2579147 RepID=A0ABT0D815_9HYPH|nr:hypothetical protein [Ancylobacter crimeensis]MCK0196087.1 hypothetical protein [Ancylobacter crimeensis]